MFILSPSLRLNFSKKILGLAAAANLPVQAHRKEWVDPQQNDKGALFSLGVDLAPVGTAAARFVDSILKGAKPADLPAQEVPKVEFALSLKRAAELGIKVPADVISQADPVYRSHGEAEPMVATPARPHRRLVWKYVAVVGTLVAAAIVSVGISEFWFSYEDSKRAVTEAEADKASSAAISIRQFIHELADDLDGVARPIPDDAAGTGRQQVFRNLLLRQRAITGLTYLDATGRACVQAYSTEVDKIDSLTCEADVADGEAFLARKRREAVHRAGDRGSARRPAAHDHRACPRLLPGGV